MKHITLFSCVGVLLLCAMACQRGNGVPGSETRKNKDFQYIVASCDGTIIVEQGDEYAVRVSADSDLVPKIQTFVTNETLYISAKDSLSSKTPVTIQITLPRLKGLTTTKASTVIGRSLLGRELKIDIQGQTKAVFTGEVQTLTIATQNTVVLDATELKAQNANVTIANAGWVSQKLNGEGRVDVYVKDKLDVTLAAGRLRYVVPPRQWSKQISKTAIVEKWTPGPPTQVATTTTAPKATTSGKVSTKKSTQKSTKDKSTGDDKKDALDKVMGY